MTNDKLPDDDHILRYAKQRDLRTSVDADDNENVIGLNKDAFKLRDDEKTLSVTWIEFFDGEFTRQKIDAVKAFRLTFPSSAKSALKGAFGVGQVNKAKLAAARYNQKIRILHEPDDNPGHSAIHRIPRDNEKLLEDLAFEVFADFVLNKDVPL